MVAVSLAVAALGFFLALGLAVMYWSFVRNMIRQQREAQEDKKIQEWTEAETSEIALKIRKELEHGR